MIEEALWNGFVLCEPDGQFRLGTDSVACAWFSRFPRGSRVADLGCGSGAISLMLLASDPTLHVTGIELDPPAAAAAEENARRNGASFFPMQADLRELRTLPAAGSMDAAISNPPYFPVGSGRAAAHGSRFRSEETCSLSQLFAAAQWLLRWGGSFVLVHRGERLADLLCEGRAHQLEPKRLRFVRHRPGSAVSLVLLECRKGGRPGLQYEPELILFDENGQETAEYKQMYHKER